MLDKAVNQLVAHLKVFVIRGEPIAPAELIDFLVRLGFREPSEHETALNKALSEWSSYQASVRTSDRERQLLSRGRDIIEAALVSLKRKV